MLKNKNFYLLAAVIILLLSVVIINGCGDDATTIVTPTSTPTTKPVTPTSTIAPTATFTPTPVPTVKDVSDQFNISADYYIGADPNTGVTAGTLIVQLYQKSTSTLSIKGFEIKSSYNPDFPFFGAVPYIGTFNAPPADWATKADLTLLQWQGTTALTIGNVYAFNTKYPNLANMPKTLTIDLTAGTATTTVKDGAGAESVLLGTLQVNIVQRLISPTAVPTYIPSKR